MELRTQYLLLLFVFGVIAKGMVKSAFGSNLSILLLACVGYYYWRTKQKEKSVYDDIARQQAEAAAKLDALHGVGDGRVTELSMAMRTTSFKLNEADTGVITDRIHQYSSKMAGSRKDRRKFLRKNSKTVNIVDINDPEQIAAVEASKSLPTIEPSVPEVMKGKKTKKPIGSIVEEAVDATL
ncbi:hypothetical protein BBO99_00002332 [Phytophthora kernoviae]|uniref:Uncharacterized protein n=2 Tax=Phytophthora kernoviae TaxID=325452 RepID=A0A3R7H1Q5_9STRA|nr:hypothetical protein G195_002787 [Phytophthora kernoviae 00238/432]KAG2529763.1 hypothetical protein JM16_001962 [Phytophthora kernoviae]KAG2530964.1 hypothetical protein JM18_001951 [Phytophthora kernoviae]RLN06805.1 hypothetical protein BBI17_002134 [Phytophthora kernoviae]RLN83197.1 hypothetical protein BBO99_00002332 [Phytophthora kernoviae]